jgi:hypothetical protein
VSPRAPVWRRQALLWGVPLALVALNLLWLVLFQSGFRLRAASLDRALDQARRAHGESAARRAQLESLWVAAAENQQRIERLYVEGFSTERGRLTETIRLVKDLAARAGLAPRSIGYPEETLADFGLTRRSFVFDVEGSYADLRTFLHLLELSPAFVSVTQIGVGEASRGGLQVSLRLSTFFESLPSDEAAPQAGPPGPAVGEGR